MDMKDAIRRVNRVIWPHKRERAQAEHPDLTPNSGSSLGNHVDGTGLLTNAGPAIAKPGRTTNCVRIFRNQCLSPLLKQTKLGPKHRGITREDIADIRKTKHPKIKRREILTTEENDQVMRGQS